MAENRNLDAEWSGFVRKIKNGPYCDSFKSFVYPRGVFPNVVKVYESHDTADNRVASRKYDHERSATDRMIRSEIVQRDHAAHLFFRCMTLLESNPNDPFKRSLLRTFSTATNSEAELFGALVLENLRSPGERRLIVLRGARGSGKSTTQNRLFTLYKDKLDAEKIFFVRCDASKLYSACKALLAARVKFKQRILEKFSIADYFKFQLLYVVCKYGSRHTDSIEGEIFSKFISFISAEEREDLHNETWGMLTLIEKEMALDSQDHEVHRRERRETPVVKLWKENLINLNEHGGFRKALRMGAKIEKLLMQSGFSILEVMDGVDNIRWHIPSEEGSSEEKFNEKELYECCKKDIANWGYADGAKTQLRTIKLLVVREETLSHLRELLPLVMPVEKLESSLVGRLDKDHEVVVNHVPPDFIEVVRKKIEVLSAEICPEDERRRIFEKYPDIDSKELGELIEQVRFGISNRIEARNLDMYARFIELLLTSFKFYVEQTVQIIQDTFKDEACEFSEGFHSNLRAFTFNFLEYYRYLQRHNFDDEGLRQRFVYREYFLAGNDFIFTSDGSDGSEMASSFMYNIFWYDLKFQRAPDRWLGLVFIRIFQYLDDNPAGTRYEDLVRVVTSYFDYPELVVTAAVDKALVFGLLSLKVDGWAAIPLLQVTTKGRFCVRLSLGKIDLLYYASLDTPLVREAKGFLQIHQESGLKDRDFLYAVLSGSYHLLGHIQMQHQLEVDRIKELYQASKEGLAYVEIGNAFSCFYNPARDFLDSRETENSWKSVMASVHKNNPDFDFSKFYIL